MVVLNPDRYLLPDYKISPFQTSDIAFNADLPHDESADEYFRNRFKGRNYVYTPNGRRALYRALKYYNLQRQDVVTILTTSGNFYVSSCVTGEVDKFCSWNREVVAGTKVIIVVHEFGYPYTGLNELTKLNIPIIEDCAYAFFSEDPLMTIGRVGEFCVYSFPKMFPIQIGGLLTFWPEKKIKEEEGNQSGTEQYIKQVLSYAILRKEEIIRKRLLNYKWLQKAMLLLGLTERFDLQEGVVPGVFMFKVQNEKINLQELKDSLFAHGIQCSVFYGERSFFIPNHQKLNETDLHYFITVIQSFVHENGKHSDWQGSGHRSQ